MSAEDAPKGPNIEQLIDSITRAAGKGNEKAVRDAIVKNMDSLSEKLRSSADIELFKATPDIRNSWKDVFMRNGASDIAADRIIDEVLRKQGA
jgi:hypothetical protein